LKINGDRGVATLPGLPDSSDGGATVLTLQYVMPSASSGTVVFTSAATLSGEILSSYPGTAGSKGYFRLNSGASLPYCRQVTIQTNVFFAIQGNDALNHDMTLKVYSTNLPSLNLASGTVQRVRNFVVNGTNTASGIWGASNNSLAEFKTSAITNSGLLIVGAVKTIPAESASILEKNWLEK
jgi:hypothetical protein